MPTYVTASAKVRHHQQRLLIAQQPPDHSGGSAVTADQAVRPELPKVARHRHRRDGRFRNVVFALDSAAFHLIRIAQKGVQILVGDPKQRQVEILGQQPAISSHNMTCLAAGG